MNEVVTAQDDVLAAVYRALVDRAQRRKTTTYGKLYDDLAPEFGWPKRTNGNSWPRRLQLAQLGTLNGRNGEPALAALVRYDKPGRPIGVGYKTAHLNCHGEPLLIGHDDCPATCETCYAAANIVARREEQLCYAHFNRQAP